MPQRFIGRCVSEGVAPYRWRLVEDFGYESRAGRVLTVPAGFETDFASVPRLLWPILPLSDAVYDKAAVLHDYAVRNRKRLGYSLMDCHQLFREVLLFSGTGRVKTAVMYAAVVCFNWINPGAGLGKMFGTKHRLILGTASNHPKCHQDIDLVTPWAFFQLKKFGPLFGF